MRIRTDFVTRPPQLDQESLRRIWHDVEILETPFLGATDLAATKKTNREKDYAVIGELARRMPGLALSEAHREMVTQAESLLPFVVPGGWP